ncbi:MAG: CoA transferase [Gordonia sp. (in: high G+C Gram-positive bacteria)]|uniref:CaiB/BaiF CoA transferase family protein n=1 Tax=Gordonia sp. (in: high G+C Gram-positive bacteria) TaxID=84139 RepID=UPI0039E3BB02
MHKPLEGIRVLEIGGYIALPFGTSLLCALGADVVKVERPVVGEDFRRRMNEKSPYFRQYNTGKRSIAVDLKNPEGVELVKSLIPRFDVVMENMRPGKVAAMGLGPDDAKAVHPDVIYASVTGFGGSGPLSGRPAYDTIGQSYGGLYSILGDEGHPQLAGGLNADLITGVCTAAGILAALVGKLKTGQTPYVQTSIMEAVSLLTTDSITQYFEYGYDPTRTSRHPQAQNFCVETSDHEFFAMHLSSSEKFWQALCAAMDRDDLRTDPRFAEYRSREANYFELAEVVAEQFTTRSAQDWEQALVKYDVPFAPVLSMSGYLENPQVKHLDMVEEQDDDLALLRPPWTFDARRPDRPGTAPRVGEHSYDVAAEVLPGERVDALIQAGVLYVDPGPDA